MKKLFNFIKENYMMVFFSIIAYQAIITIFFFSTLNLRILGFLIVLLAIKIIVGNYKEPVKDFIKGLFKRK